MLIHKMLFQNVVQDVDPKCCSKTQYVDQDIDPDVVPDVDPKCCAKLQNVDRSYTNSIGKRPGSHLNNSDESPQQQLLLASQRLGE